MNGKPSTLEAEGRLTFPHGWFWPMVIVSGFGLICTLAFADPTLSLQKKKEMWAAAVFWHIGEFILLCAFTHRLWKRLQDGETEITPGKAVGFIFIPFFGLYWFFQVWAGYATALNNFFERHDIPLRASKGITVTFTITWLLGRLLDWTPIGPLLALVGWVMEMVFVAHTGKLTSNLAGLTAPAPGMKRCPLCACHTWLRPCATARDSLSWDSETKCAIDSRAWVDQKTAPPCPPLGGPGHGFQGRGTSRGSDGPKGTVRQNVPGRIPVLSLRKRCVADGSCTPSLFALR